MKEYKGYLQTCFEYLKYFNEQTVYLNFNLTPFKVKHHYIWK